MKELLESLEADFDDVEGWIRIVDADWFADDLKLNLSIQFNDRDAEMWEVACVGVVEESLCSQGVSTLAVSLDSPLLKSFVEPQVEIMFSENAVPAESLFGIICSCCMEVMGRPESIPRFMNGASTMNGICSSRYGLLGKFPESVAARILHALKDRAIRVNALPGHVPKQWNGSQYVDHRPLQALEIGASYVIAEAFGARRV